MNAAAVQAGLVERCLDLGRFFPEEACQLHFLVSDGGDLRQGSVVVFCELIFYCVELQADGKSKRIGIQSKRIAGKCRCGSQRRTTLNQEFSP